MWCVQVHRNTYYVVLDLEPIFCVQILGSFIIHISFSPLNLIVLFSGKIFQCPGSYTDGDRLNRNVEAL